MAANDQPRAALISQMDPPPGAREEFEAWYAEEHVPIRMRLPGFVGATRAWAVEGKPAHLVVYHLEEIGALDRPEYRAVKDRPSALTARMLSTVAAFTRFLGQEIADSGPTEPGRYLYLVTFQVPAARQADFDEWYQQDHLPLLLRHPAWLRCRRYDIVDGEPAGITRAAIHELADLEALRSPERAEARATPWRARLAKEPWFDSARYAVYERHQEFVAAPSGAAG